jgi:hypothetical protein
MTGSLKKLLLPHVHTIQSASIYLLASSLASVSCGLGGSLYIPDSKLPACFCSQLALRVRREGSDYIVEACIPDAATSAGEGSTHAATAGAGPAAAAAVQIGSGAIDSPTSEWTQLRICHLLEDVSPAGVGRDGKDNITLGQQLEGMAGMLPLGGVAAGLYACSPRPGNGFEAVFDHLYISKGRLAGHM